MDLVVVHGMIHEATLGWGVPGEGGRGSHTKMVGLIAIHFTGKNFWIGTNNGSENENDYWAEKWQEPFVENEQHQQKEDSGNF